MTIYSFKSFSGPDHRRPTSMPEAIATFVNGWEAAAKSPYSDSFYDTAVKTWDHTPENCMRVSDHWNFSSQGEIHCTTDRPVINGYWTLAQRSGGVWVVLATCAPNSRELAEKIAIAQTARALAYHEWSADERRLVALLLRGPALKSELFGREHGATARGALDDLERIGLVDDFFDCTGVSQFPPEVQAKFAKHPRAKDVYLLKPALADMVRGVPALTRKSILGPQVQSEVDRLCAAPGSEGAN